MQWDRIRRQPGFPQSNVGSTGIDWSDAGFLANTDPYIVWSDVRASSGRDWAHSTIGELPPDSAPTARTVHYWFDCLIELKSPSGIEQLKKYGVVPTHLRPYGQSRFLSCSVLAPHFGALVEKAIDGKDFVTRLELTVPRNAEYQTEHSDSGVSGTQARAGAVGGTVIEPAFVKFFQRVSHPKLVERKFETSKQERRSAMVLKRTDGKGESAKPPTPIVCVIDDRCNFAHADYWSAAGVPRIKSIWHQGEDFISLDRLSKNWTSAIKLGRQFDRSPCAVDGDREDQFRAYDGGASYGRVLQIAEVRRAQYPRKLGPPTDQCSKREYQEVEPLVSDDEPGIYRLTGYLSPMAAWSHGSAVLGQIAGSDASIGGRRSGRRRRFVPDRIRFVQLPSLGVLDTSGQSLGGHVLDAIHHALEEAEAETKRGTPPPPVIVNLSYGTHSGPHNGATIFDQALRELLDDHPHLHAVLPAGNGHLLRVHAHAWLTPSRPSATLLWKVFPDNPADSFLEVWLDAQQAIDISITPPGMPPQVVKRGEARMWIDGPPNASHTVRAAAVYVTGAAQSRGDSMVLLAVAPTRLESAPGRPEPADAPSRTMHAPHGVWQVQVRMAPGQSAVQFHAWAQRGDAPPGRGRAFRGSQGRQSYFLDSPDCEPDPYLTLNGIATGPMHPRLWVVGALRRSDGSISDYSASGPTRDCLDRFDGPDVVTLADESLNQPGMLTYGTGTGSRTRINGTSIAAATFSRLLYDELARGGAMHWPPPDQPSRERPCVEGEPQRAPMLHRGEVNRLVPDPED